MSRASIMAGTWAAVVAVLMGSALLVHSDMPVQAAPPTFTPHCSSAQLLIRPINRGLGAAAGTVGRWYRLHELWGGHCRLRGFPGVELLDRNFHTLPRHISRGHGMIISDAVPIHRVILDQQHDAYFALEFTDVPNGNRPCRSAPYLMFIPPNDRLPVVTYSGGLAPCPGQVVVSPVEPTPTLRSFTRRSSAMITTTHTQESEHCVSGNGRSAFPCGDLGGPHSPSTVPEPAAPAIGARPLTVNNPVKKPTTHFATNLPISYAAVSFLNTRTGWVLAARGMAVTVLRTSNAGRSWMRIGRLSLPFSTPSMQFVDARRGWISTIGPTLCGGSKTPSCHTLLLRTVDGGRHWSHFSAPNINGNGGSITLVDRLHGWLIHRQIPCKSVCLQSLYTTVDGGMTWHPLRAAPHLWTTSMSLVDRQRGWLSGRSGNPRSCMSTIFATADGGRTWMRQLTLPRSCG